MDVCPGASEIDGATLRHNTNSQPGAGGSISGEQNRAQHGAAPPQPEPEPNESKQKITATCAGDCCRPAS
jgi:hypothetical protein